MNKSAIILIGLLLSQAAPAAQANDLQRGAGAAAGIVAGIYIHELGHGAAFSANGAEQISIRVPGPQCVLLCGQTDALLPVMPSPAARRVISTAGFMASNVAAELLLRNESAARSAFGQGFVATNLYSNVSHVVIYYTKIRGRDGYRGNDIDNFELAGGNPHVLSAALVTYSLYALQRAHKKRIPVMFMQVRF